MVLNYIGSKKSLLNFIDYVVNKNIQIKKKIIFGDLFAGTGVVGDYFNKKYKTINISNDLEFYSYIINYANLKCEYTKKIQKIIDEMNSLEEKEGLIYENYAPSIKNVFNRMFFTCENAKKMDACLHFLNKLKVDEKVDEKEYTFLLASIIENIDKVANTACVYGAFLKKYKTSALKLFKVNPIHDKTSIHNNEHNKIYNKDIIEILDKNFDLVYLDPPYNHRQYGGNYSQLNFIAKYDKNIKIKGKTGLVENYNKSKFCQKKNVKIEFINLITKLKTKHILISYNNEGLLSLDELQEILSKKGKLKTYILEYKKFKSHKIQKKKNVKEYLHYVDCNKSGKIETIYIDSLNNL